MFNSLENAYQYCESVTRKHAKSFYFASKFLPKEKRKPIYALYALCRHIDDEIDKARIDDEKSASQEIEKWRSELNRLYRQGEISYENVSKNVVFEDCFSQDSTVSDLTHSRLLILMAWKEVLSRYPIPLSLLLELIKGVLMDTYVKRYDTFQQLYVYCYRVASTVGLMSSEIFGYKDREALFYAEAMGIAMQMTNILRDIGEDALMNRIYLPQEDLQGFGVSEQQIFQNEVNKNFIELMKFEIERTREFYKKAEKGIPLLEKDTRFTVLVASRIYAKILDEIEKQNYDVFRRRAHTSLAQKIANLPRIWLELKKLNA
jgi:15-cis-phytoene synthase